MLKIITGYDLERYRLDSFCTHFMPKCEEHPSEQSRFGSDIAKRAKNEDLIVVTHSDHVFNGIRVAVWEGEVDPEDIQIVFFDRNNEPIDLKIDVDGRIDRWPMGFFDQVESDLLKMLGPGKNNPRRVEFEKSLNRYK